jgi:hypothetical protein
MAVVTDRFIQTSNPGKRARPVAELRAGVVDED